MKIFVKPGRPGLIVRDPATREALPPEGDAVPRTTYWLRALAAGDVVEAEPPDEEKPAHRAPPRGGRSK